MCKNKKDDLTLSKDFACKLCVDAKEGIVEPGKEISFFDQVDFVKRFCLYGGQVERQCSK